MPTTTTIYRQRVKAYDNLDKAITITLQARNKSMSLAGQDARIAALSIMRKMRTKLNNLVIDAMYEDDAESFIIPAL